MRTISYSECNSFEGVRKLLEQSFSEIDEINFVIAPEKAKRLEQLVKDKALIEKKAKADAEAKAQAEAKAKEIADAQVVINKAAAVEKNKAERDETAAETLERAKKVIAASKKGDKDVS